MSEARVTALIAEDEQPQRAELRALLTELWPDLEIVAECEDGLAAIEALTELRPQVAFLDIRMPGVSGLEVARAGGDIAQIVFITAYNEFAVNAFENAAVDYLLKPVRRERLAATIERLRQRLNQGGGNLTQLIAALQAEAALKQPRKINWISASVGDTIKMIPIDDVLFFKSEDKYTRVVTATESAHIRTPLKELIAQLDPEEFWQVHRSVIVRVAAIRAIKRDEDGRLKISITGKVETLPVSAVFRDRFRPM